VLGLPPAAAGEADAGVQGMVPEETGKEVAVRRRVGIEGLGLAEDRLPLRATRGEVGLGGERQVEL
jgi:hypothetical protein